MAAFGFRSPDMAANYQTILKAKVGSFAKTSGWTLRRVLWPQQLRSAGFRALARFSVSRHKPLDITRRAAKATVKRRERLIITHNSILVFFNPKGISPQSPGLRGTSYPGLG